MKLRSSKLKSKEELQPQIMKKQRTKRSRRVRSQISSILISNLISLSPQKNKGFPVDANSSLQGDEVSCNLSRVLVDSSARKRKLREPYEKKSNDDLQLRRNTRSYFNQNGRKINEVELSESSCVDSNFGIDCVVSGNRSTKLKRRIESAKDSKTKRTSISVNKSEISYVERSALSGSRDLEKLPSESNENDAVSIASVVDSSFSRRTDIEGKKRAIEAEFEILKNDAVSIEESVVKPKQNSLKIEADLSCAEHFSFDYAVSEHSSSHGTAFSELQSELFVDCSSELEFSDYTPSIFLDSGSEFSVKSADDSPPSRTYSFLLEFRQQFSRSSVPLDSKRSLFAEAECLEHLSFVKFVDEDDEESYRRFRERERRKLFLYDYVDMYRTTTECGDLIFHQRLQMVHWIIEQSTAKEFHHETMFLGVSLLDRFLGKGYFKNKRNLQIVGIACLTLATRIEENQPYNSVRQKNFHIENNVYSRSEVVAMEWLVQEVLNFQCFLPTIHTFMWFYLKAARANAKLERRARYLAKLALSDYEHLRHWPSTVAAGLVILASLETDQIESYQRVIEVHVRTNENDLHECIKTLEWLLQYVS
ncbi:cyclin-SDS [Euphorbia lathyris]|uniref:cyclin-SDS n=1 Tax=Euphorbia lathyris TaxID=212925 RepID=UPI003314376D